MQPLLDKHGLAKFLGVPVSWVEEANAARRLPITWVGRYARYDLDDIAVWLGQSKEYPEGFAPAPVISLATGPRPPAGPLTPPPPAGPATPSKASKAA